MPGPVAALVLHLCKALRAYARARGLDPQKLLLWAIYKLGQMQTMSSSSVAMQQMQHRVQPFAAGTRAVRCLAQPRSQHQHCATWAASMHLQCSRTTTTSKAVALQQSCRRSSSSRGRRIVVQASWGVPVEFTAAKLISNCMVAQQLHVVVLDVGELAARYTRGGQFMQIKVGEGKPGFFAIASPPDPNNQGLLEFLIKAQGEAAEAVVGLTEGAEVQVSPVMGKGFPVDKIPADSYPTVLLFATGSGISPIKALIESGDLQADKRSDVRLYYGTRDEAHTAYANCISNWEKLGVKTIQVFSNENGNGSKYVQDVFAEDMQLDSAERSGVGVLLCGHKDMCNAVKEIVAAQGVDAEKVLLNF